MGRRAAKGRWSKVRFLSEAKNSKVRLIGKASNCIKIATIDIFQLHLFESALFTRKKPFNSLLAMFRKGKRG